MAQRFLLLLILLLVAGLGGALWLGLQVDPQTEQQGLTPGSGPARPADPVLPGSGSAVRTPDLPPPKSDPKRPATTVILPLELELELVAARGRLAADGEPPLGSAATARLRGSVHGVDGQPLRAVIEFVAGPNLGRVLDCDERGRFGANDLLAGLSLVRVDAPGSPGSLREVLLREERDSEQLNIGFGRSAIVFGQVRDQKNAPIPFAKVVMDGQEAETDDKGVFRFVRMTSGKVPVYISKPGYASYREMQFITAASTIALGKLKYTLAPAARLKVTVNGRVGTGGPGSLFLSGPLEPGEYGKQRKYPWHLKSPATIYAGETIEIDDLPAGQMRLQLFQPGAVVEPPTALPTLIAGELTDVVFRLKPAPILSGLVTLDGKPVQRALVQLEAPNVTRAAVDALGGRHGRAKLEMELLNPVPPAVQKVLTGADGRFQFSASEEISAVRYLTARSPDGKRWAGRIVEAGEREIELALGEVAEGQGSILVETSTRHQPLPVEYTVNGKPSAVLLEVGARLPIEGLPEGSWHYKARWGNELIQDSTPLIIEGQLELFVPLPEGAIQGQPKPVRDAMQ